MSGKLGEASFSHPFASLACSVSRCSSANFYSEFTVNMISNWFIESANFTSGSFDPGVDEVDMSGLTPMPSVRVCADHHVSICLCFAMMFQCAKP